MFSNSTLVLSDSGKIYASGNNTKHRTGLPEEGKNYETFT